MAFVEANGIRICYEIAGAGPRLLYVSGTAGDLRKKPNALSGPFPGRFEVLAFDQRGMGRSDKPDAPYTMAMYGDDAAALMDAVGWHDALVIGVSFGGMVVQELALRHPDKVKRLVICCASAGGHGGSSYPLHEIMHLPLEERVRRSIARNDMRRDEAWQCNNVQAYAKLFEDGIAAANFAADEPGHGMGARRQLEARAGHDTWDRLPRLSMPVMVCGGRHDGQATPQVVRKLAGRIPGARLEFFEGGHLFLNEDPKAVPAVAAFLLGS
jgi:3-oxoadipate enol-lactonase